MALANRTVPVNFPVKLNFKCLPVLSDLYFLLKPKSIRYITFGSFLPIKKLSGFISRWTKPFECTHWIRSNICLAIKHISAKFICLRRSLKISNKDLPSKGSINILYFFFRPKDKTSGIPTPRNWNKKYASFSNKGFAIFLGSTFIATGSFVVIFEPMYTSPKAPSANFLIILYFLKKVWFSLIKFSSSLALSISIFQLLI